LFEYRTHGGQGQSRALSQQGQQMRLGAVRVFLDWLTKSGILATNPASGLESPREEHRLPRQVLSAAEVEQVLAAIPTQSRHGLRDRAMLETFYCCGIRRGELLALHLTDLQRDTGLLRVNHGKGSRDRVVPISPRALSWIDRYLLESRPYWVTPSSGNLLFLTQRGTALSPNQASLIVRHWIDLACLGETRQLPSLAAFLCHQPVAAWR
jgi:integrase/recombinase XerD